MLEIHGKIHDRYTLEFKVGYSRYSPSAAVSDFMMDTWIFIPDSLYINAKTYPKSNFYRDFRALVRLITPVYTLEEVADEEALPLSRLLMCCRELAEEPSEEHEKTYEHQIKMFGSITRSALRTAAVGLYRETEVNAFRVRLDGIVLLLARIMAAYREIPRKAGLDRVAFELRSRYDLGEEYLCRMVNMHLFRVMEYAREHFPKDYTRVVAAAATYIDGDLAYQRERGFLLPEEGNSDNNRNFLHRAGQLHRERFVYIGRQEK